MRNLNQIQMNRIEIIEPISLNSWATTAGRHANELINAIHSSRESESEPLLLDSSPTN